VSRIYNTSKAELGRKHHNRGRAADDIRTHIHTHCLTIMMLQSIFADPEITSEITRVKD